MRLYHHGVKGQKWGVRRYQDKNGRLTPAGKTHVKGGKLGLNVQSSESYERYGYRSENTTYTNRKAANSSGRKKVDSIAENENYYEASSKWDYAAERFLSNYEKKGEKYATDVLSKELDNTDFRISRNSDVDVETGEKYVTYALTVLGDKYQYESYGETDYSDGGWFQKRLRYEH